MPSAHSEPKEIFAAALECESPEEQRAYLAEACGENHDLRAEVESLLAAHNAAGGFLDRAIPDRPAAKLSTGTAIGPYKLLELVGEGGMGEVYMAQQKTPIRRRVALKLIKLGMDSQRVVARFEAERQALAMMSHPGIARIFDGGMTDDGRPYFVMELVRGVPVDEYCDQTALPLPDRLRLFVDVCRAVQHAHHKGIIHRDLKPANIMITRHDGAPVVKIIDFGIAKALDHDLTDKTVFTRFSELVGTPAYMSPEQAEMSGRDIDTRSDVYSLGVLLYKLLTGVTPFDESVLKNEGLDEMRRIIREEEPVRPSHRVTTFNNQLASTITTDRATDTRTLSLSLRGDLDWIVMRALAKNRDSRYESASELAEEIEAYLDRRPIKARPPSIVGSIRKWCQRHPALLFSTVAILLVSTIASSIAAVLVSRESRDRRNALISAERSRQETQATIDFLISDLLLAARPGEYVGQDVTVNEVLARAEERVGRSLADQPLVEASVRIILGEVNARLGNRAKALEHHQRALQLRTAQLDDTDQDTMAARFAVGMSLWRLGPDDPERLSEARDLVEGVLEFRKRVHGPTHPRTLTVMHDLALILTDQGQYQGARGLLEQVLTARTERPNPSDEDIGSALHTLGLVAKHELNTTGAQEYFERSWRLRSAALGEDHPDTLNSRAELARVLLTLGEPDTSLGHHRAVLEARRRVLPTAHPSTILSLDVTAKALFRRGDRDEARELFRESLVLCKQRYGERHYQTALVLSHLGGIARGKREYAEARRLYEEAVDILRERDSTYLAPTLTHLGIVLSAQKEHDLALAVDLEARDLYKQRQQTAPDDLANTTALGGAICNVGTNHGRAGRYSEALPYFDEAIEVLSEVLDKRPSHSSARQYLTTALDARAVSFEKLGRYSEAMEDYGRLLEFSDPKRHPRFRNKRARLLVLMGDHQEAVAKLTELLTILPDHDDADSGMNRVIAPKNAGGEYYNAACGFALAVAAAERDEDLNDETRTALIDEYSQLAIESLRASADKGYFERARSLELLQTDTDLDSIRARPEVRAFIDQTTGASGPADTGSSSVNDTTSAPNTADCGTSTNCRALTEL